MRHLVHLQGQIGARSSMLNMVDLRQAGAVQFADDSELAETPVPNLTKMFKQAP